MRRWRLYTILVVCTVLPLLLFLYAADLVVRKTTTNSILKATGPAAELAATAITERFSDAKASLESLAADPSLLGAWSHHDTPRLVSTLRMSRSLMRGVASFAIYDRNGNLRAGDPVSGHTNASSITSSRWFTAVMQSGKAYVSGVGTVAGDGSAVTVAAPLNPQHPDGVLVAVYTIDTVRSWMSSIAPANMKWIGVIDQNGVNLAGAGLGASGQLRDVSSRPEVKQVLAGKDGTEFVSLEGRQVLVTRLPLPSLGWGVLVEIPASEIDAAIWKFEQPVAITALIFVGLALAIGIVIASLYRRLRESEEHTRQIVSAATDAFISIDASGAITDWNPKAEEIFGWSKAEAVGQPLHATIIPPQYRDAHLRGMAHLRATGEGPVLNTRLELSALHRDGREFPIELSITRVYRGGKVFFNAFLHDISKRKHAEEEIGTLNAELSVRVSELEERNKALEAFSYSVSHDVRAPLRNIAGFSEILREEYARQLSPPGLDYLQRIQSNVARMQRLVDDLLRFARLGEQGLKPQRTSLDELVREVIAGLESDLSGRRVTFEVSPLPVIACDRGLITQVFWNLLANAVKFTRGRNQAVISVGLSSHDDEDILFVRDNGVGFDMKRAGRLFGAFQRFHRDDEFEGTGVGLATVQRIILKHQGRIWAHSEPDLGATFFFTLWPARPVDQRFEVAQAR
ncbi:MAG TPA: PAS domain S-box protein [Candidatus Angelobacter sp.]|nr:PAS domain S-box protein [Candidatus Angelobacter sp.]